MIRIDQMAYIALCSLMLVSNLMLLVMSACRLHVTNMNEDFIKVLIAIGNCVYWFAMFIMHVEPY